MSYRMTVALWAFMVFLIGLAAFVAPPAHAIQAYPDITAGDKQQSETLPIDDIIPSIGPAVYYTSGTTTAPFQSQAIDCDFDGLHQKGSCSKVGYPTASQITELDRINNQNRLFSWVVTIFIVIFACGWLLFMLLTPWQFPHYGESGRSEHKRGATDKCAMPVKKPDALWRKLLD